MAGNVLEKRGCILDAGKAYDGRQNSLYWVRFRSPATPLVLGLIIPVNFLKQRELFMSNQERNSTAELQVFLLRGSVFDALDTQAINALPLRFQIGAKPYPQS